MCEIESMLVHVWNSGTRSFADEARRCYKAGALRASIAATWTVVTAVIIAKIALLAHDGDSAAKDFSDKVVQAQRHGLTAEGVRAMQGIEAI